MTVRHRGGGYDTDGVVPDGPLTLPRGTNYLVVSDDADDAADVVYRVLAAAPRYDEDVILVTTAGTAGGIVETYQSALDHPDDLDHLRVVDASHSGIERDTGPLSPASVEAATSPADVTGIGVGVTNHLRSIKSDRVRLGMVSLSPVVDRIGPERTFAFMHVLTSRVRTADLVGLYVVDSSRHEPEHVRVMGSLTDGAFTVRSHDGRRQLRGTGAVDGVSEWTDLG